jgi:glycosyltransferase involved in cell wall biosynthesis
LIVGGSIWQADVICVPSQSTRRGLLGLPTGSAKDIRVVCYGVEDHYFPRDPVSSAKYIAERYCTSEDYVCAVGTIEPRKNLARLIEAFAILHACCSSPPQLLVAGTKGWKTSSVYRQLAAARLTESEVKFLGYVPEEDMPFLYSGASVFVFPSLYEGFGLPLIEAMACSAPVVASNTSSIPEVVGDAAIMVDPHSPSQFADAVIQLRTNPGLRAAIVQKGLQQVKRFSWTAAAEEMLCIFCESVTRT